MERKWYYAVGGVRNGPVTVAELRVLVESGTLTDGALIWQPDFGPEWRTLERVRPLLEELHPQAAAGTVPADVPLLGVAGVRPAPLAAAAEAFERMTGVLFRSFDVVRWLSLGFCAWLSSLNISLPVGGGGNLPAGAMPSGKAAVDRALDQLVRLVEGPVSGWLVPVLLWVALGVWLCSLRSRGDFIFVHRWYRPDAPILPSWRAARAPAQALFVWRLGYYGVMGLLFAAVGGAAYTAVVRPYVHGGHEWRAAMLQPTVACGTVAILLLFAMMVVGHLVKAFVVPLMYWRGVTPARAWLAVFELGNRYPVALLGYLIVGFLCGVAAQLAVAAFVLCTCCVGALPLLLPYFNGVALLPVTLFFRGYAVCFLSRWRPELVPAAE